MSGISLKIQAKPKQHIGPAAFCEEEEAPPEVLEERTEPLVIPVLPNQFQISSTEAVSAEDAAAMQALQAQATTSKTTATANSKLTIQSNKDTFQHETQQYQKDLEKLPDQADEDAYQKVPVADFGAALLRGMGWTGQTNDKDDEPSMPRPHRLGLGATPKLDSLPTSTRPKRPDQWKQQKRLDQQRQEYEKERQEKIRMDRQKTLQNLSLVMLRDGTRARILQLVGVPGLNRVKLQVERNREATIVKRGDIDRLLTRQELEARPFVEATEELRPEEPKREPKEERKRESKKEERKESKRSREDRKDRERREDRKRSRPSWILPRIRVRIVTEKLGRRYFKEKAVVVDVTHKGATLSLASNQVLDRVPERYLETALPKPGGKVIVLSGRHKGTKGQLLERDSKKDRAVVQAYEDQSILTLSLDDLAEWCGPLDHDLED